jgi:hypothetical protein
MKVKQLAAQKREWKKKYLPRYEKPKDREKITVPYGLARQLEVSRRRYILKAHGSDAVFMREALIPLN